MVNDNNDHTREGCFRHPSDKFNRRSFLATLAVSSSALAGCMNNVGEQEDVSLLSADYMPDGHPVRSEGIVPFLEQIQAEYEGELEIDDQPAGAIGGAPELPDLIRRETADMGIISPNHSPDTFSLTGVAELPGLFDSAQEGAEALHQLFDPEDNGVLYEEELRPETIRPLFVGLWAPYQILSATENSIVSLDDWDGRSIRTGGGIMDITVDELGGTPVELPAPEIYSSMEQGIIDSTVGPLFGVPAYDLAELLESFSTNLNLGNFVFLYGINIDVYEGLPADLQDTMDKVGRNITTSMTQAMDAMDSQIGEELSEAGIEAYEVPEDDLADITNVLEGIEAIWIEREGGAAEEVLDEYLTILDNI